MDQRPRCPLLGLGPIRSCWPTRFKTLITPCGL